MVKYYILNGKVIYYFLEQKTRCMVMYLPRNEFFFFLL